MNSKIKSEGVLILSHCGYSFVEEICKLVEEEKRIPIILSSKPSFSELRIVELEKLSKFTTVTNNNELLWDDIALKMDEIEEKGISLSCCISVWEGYRNLMSKANNKLALEDLSTEKINLLTNKLELRNLLYANSLSTVNAELLTEDIFNRYKKSSTTKFIKPSKGIASIGTFKLTPTSTWSNIEKIKKDWIEDEIFKSMVSSNNNFMIEDFIEGSEYSFEVLFFDNYMNTLAIHEKLETTLNDMTTLENTCICPPLKLSKDETISAIDWLENIFTFFDIKEGCYHVEAKCNTSKKWEIIEINPRIGGSLISPSVDYFTNGYSILHLWLKSLLEEKNSNSLKNKLDKLDIRKNGVSPNNKGTFFKVFFGESGVISAIKQNKLSINPSITQILVAAGTEFNSDTKENFIGQALWTGSLEELKDNYHTLLEISDSLLTIEYKQGVSL